MMNTSPMRWPHPDDDHIDEVRIVTVPRFKTSGLSGDEWRIGARLLFYRKGQLLWQRSFSNVKVAAQALPWMLLTWGETNDYVVAQADDKDICSQPGCSNPAASTYRLKSRFSRSEGYADPNADKEWAIYIRRFCRRHLRRGDCGIEDADNNYEVIEGLGPDDAQGWQDDESPSVFGGIIKADL